MNHNDTLAPLCRNFNFLPLRTSWSYGRSFHSILNGTFAEKGLRILFCCVLLGCTDPLRSKFDDVENAAPYTSHALKIAAPPTDSLAVMTWNIRFGSGRIPLYTEGWGDRYSMTLSEIESNMLMICRKINEVDPDILLLQEIDVESKRTAYVDELQFVLDHTRLNYAVFASIRKSDFEPGNGTGRINVGNAVLAKWPLKNGVRIALPVRADQSYFHSHRNILEVSLQLPGHSAIQVLTLHADPSGKDGIKKQHIDIFKSKLDELAANGQFFVAGGDFNALPPGSPRWSGFPDTPPRAGSAGEDYSGEKTWMVSLYATYAAAIDLVQYQINPSHYYSLTEDANGYWCRTLDHLFTNTDFHSTLVLQDSLLPNGRIGMRTMPISDHAPLYSVMGIRP